MNPVYLLALAGSVLYGAADYTGGMAARRADARAVTAFAGIGGLIVLLVGLPFTGGVTRMSDLGWGVAGGLFGGMGAMLLYRALAIGPISVASPIIGITGLALPVLVGFALGERAGLVAIAGLILAPLSIVLLGQAGPPVDTPAGTRDASGVAARPPDPRRVIAPALIAGLVVGGFLVFLGRIEAGASLWPLILARTAGIVLLGGWLIASRRALVPESAVRPLAFGCGVLDSFANLVYVVAVQQGAMSLVAALVSLAPATTVLLARGLLAERWSRAQSIGLVLALLAGVCISVG